MNPTTVAAGSHGLQMSQVKRKVVIGIGELAVSNDANEAIVTHALGSCVAVCLYDPVAGVGGMIHILLPDSKINLTRAEVQPAAFADTGIPMLFHAAYERGAKKARCRVHLVGGAAVSGTPTTAASVGKRNVLAARQILWRNGVLVEKEEVGGTVARNVTLDVGDGTVQFSNALIGVTVL
ncbi:MAG: chemotaxis protein CheD [Vicinamibacterales bacterium]